MVQLSISATRRGKGRGSEGGHLPGQRHGTNYTELWEWEAWQCVIRKLLRGVAPLRHFRWRTGNGAFGFRKQTVTLFAVQAS